MAEIPKELDMSEEEMVEQLQIILEESGTPSEIALHYVSPLKKPRTKDMVSMLDSLKVEGTTLITLGRSDMNAFRSARNVPGVKVIPVSTLNVFDVIAAKNLILDKEALKHLEKIYAN